MRTRSASVGPIYTVGHSTRTTRELLELLRAQGVEQVVDVRTIPRSRHNPQFNRPALSRSLHAAKLRYRHLEGAGRAPPRPGGLDQSRLAQRLVSPAAIDRVHPGVAEPAQRLKMPDRKSTRLNSSHT